MFKKTLYLPEGWFEFFKKYDRTEATITSETVRYGWVYYSGHFFDGETFHLHKEYFDPPTYSPEDFSNCF